MVREEPHLLLSKCTVSWLIRAGLFPFQKKELLFFFFLTFIPCRLNWKVTPQEIEFDSFQNKKLKNKSCWAKNMSLIQQELNSLNLGLKSVFQH